MQKSPNFKWVCLMILIFLLGLKSYGQSSKGDTIIPNNSEKIKALENRVIELEIMINDVDKDGVLDYLDQENNSISNSTVNSKGIMIDKNQNDFPDEWEDYIKQKQFENTISINTLKELHNKEIEANNTVIKNLSNENDSLEKLYFAEKNKRSKVITILNKENINRDLNSSTKNTDDINIKLIELTNYKKQLHNNSKTIKKINAILLESVRIKDNYFFYLCLVIGLLLLSLLYNAKSLFPLHEETVYCRITQEDEYFITAETIINAEKGNEFERVQERVYERKLLKGILPDELKRGDLFEVNIIDGKGKKCFVFKKGNRKTSVFFSDEIVDATETVKKYYSLNKKNNGS